MDDLRKMNNIAIKVAKEAGKYALENMGKLKTVEHKSGINDIVTNVDKSCEKLIVDCVKKNFPSHSILAEEGGEYSSGSAIKWVIDPLDGTINYAHTFPCYCVSVGVMVDGEVQLGVVYDPNRDELFEATLGEGAFLNGKKIHVSKKEVLQEALLVTGFAYSIEGKMANLEHFRIMLEKARAVRRLGSAAIDLCYVACGRLDGFWELGLKPWDTCAGYLVVKEAGGEITRLNGENYDIYQKDIMASNGKIHKQVIKALF